ncbi:MAG TPA: phosphoadenylyl-sulfate reductase [Candidatus Bathyarchaeia archaeon]|nr:phosphoadenylyl-sulfate reductase [Candidatus Bathyarchaeia archaeon]
MAKTPLAGAPERDLAEQNEVFERSTPQQILAWTVETFAPDAVLTCSFQHEGVVLAHMLRSLAPATPIFFIDTGYHFPETLAYRDELIERFGFPVRNLSSVMPREEFVAKYGDDLYSRDPDLCCKINKVEPLRLALVGVRAWINGRRRDQALTRRRMPIAEQLQGGLIKVNPLAAWTSRDTFRYLSEHDIPTHPLFEQGYTSIGCAPCTRPVLAGDDERSGRWAGFNKTECGLHTVLGMDGGDEESPANAGSAAPAPAALEGDGKVVA